jgi:protein-disulfide isomerase
MAKEQKASQAADNRAAGGGMNTGVAVIGFLLCFLAGAALMWGWDKKHPGAGGDIAADDKGSSGPAAAGGTWSDSDSPIPVTSKDPMVGKRDAPITVVIFSDYQCPYCKRVEPTLQQVRTTYGDKVRMIWKNQPLSFHQNAKPAAEAGQGVFEMAGNDAYWKFHDAAFEGQTALSDDNYVKWAQAAGVKDVAKFKAGLSSHAFAKKVDDDMNVAKTVGVSGTPAFYVNGVFINGAQPFEKFKEVIDAELGKANAKIAAGTKKDQVYVAMSKENKKNAPAPAEEEGEKEDTKTVFKVPVGNSPILGNPNALVTVIEFSDFQCPYCSRVEPTIKGLRDKYGDKIRFVWKDEPLPFHPRAEPAAELTREARAEKGNDGFWKAHDKLFENQKSLNDEDLFKYAGELGLDVAKVKAAIANHTYKKDIDADADIAEDFQANGTPHFFVNGRRLVGAQPQEKFEKIVDEEIKRAQALLAAGTKPADLYDALVKDGKGPPDAEKKAVPPPLATSPYFGGASAKVVIQEWSDFQCPFCSRVEDTVKEVKKTYGDKVKFVWHDLPLPMHPDAPLASQAGREAFKQKGNDAFWKIHDKMFANQKDLKRETLDGYAKELGLDMDKWKNSLDNMVYKAAIDADAKIGNDNGISGTPAFVITGAGNPQGYYISGAQPFTKFRKLIDKAMSEAK